ncbi:MAG: endopeptidase La [Lachnospiraceae bacterium]
MEPNTEYMLPMIVLTDLVIMPDAIVHFDIKKDVSINGINAAIKENMEVIVAYPVVNQLVEPITTNQLSYIGTISKVKQTLKLPKDGGMRIILEGVSRANILDIISKNTYNCCIFTCGDTENVLDDNEQEAFIRSIKSILKVCYSCKMIPQKSVLESLFKITKLDLLIDMIAEAVPLPYEARLRILEILDLKKRSDFLIATLLNEIEVAKIREEIATRLKDCVNKNQRDYVLREQLKVIHEELGEENTETEASLYEDKLNQINPPVEVKEKIQKEINRFKTLSYASSESGVLRNYIETVLEYPWNISGKDNVSLQKAIATLEKDHYGLTKIKERIIDYLAVRNLSGRKDAPIICLVGPPGTGKTSIAKSIASALHKKYGRIALGGVRDEAEIRGHRKTYIGAMPGRIVSTISKTGVNNPLILLDEIDKTGMDHKGDTASALLEVLDGEQNAFFTDHFFEVPVDLSNVLFVATANDATAIPEPLRDRMELIEVNSYTENEKFHIAKLYLLKKQLIKNGLTRKQFQITDEAIYKLIRNYTKEAGVRNLERLLGNLMQKTARGILTEEWKSMRVTPKKLPQLLGVEKYSEDSYDYTDKVGVVTGLAWTKVGGDTLNVEVNLLDGKGDLKLTGNLGDVMKESAQIALSYIRTLPAIKELDEGFFENHIIHVHVPEGATPKDGPSAGITMALAMYSVLTNRQVSGRLAMTGEISLKGKVLPIGGLKEKLLAAKNAGMKKVLVPVENRKNVEELEAEIIDGLEIIYVSTMEEVIANGIVRRSFTLKPSKEGLPSVFHS